MVLCCGPEVQVRCFLNLLRVVTTGMTNPLILKIEKFGYAGNRRAAEFFCFRCGEKIVFEENEYAFDPFGRIFCCDGCRWQRDTEEL